MQNTYANFNCCQQEIMKLQAKDIEKLNRLLGLTNYH